MASPHVSSLTGNSDKCKCFQKCHSSSFGSRSKAWLLQKIFERSSKTLSSVWSYIKVPPAKSVLATICCGLSLIGMLLEYYCTLGGIVQVSLHCYPIRPSGDNRTRPAGGRNLNWARGASCTRLHCVAGEKNLAQREDC